MNPLQPPTNIQREVSKEQKTSTTSTNQSPRATSSLNKKIITNPPPANSYTNSFDCGKPTFIVVAGGPSGPYGEIANTRAKEYFNANDLVIMDEGGSRFVVEPSHNAKEYWMKRIQDDGIGSTQYDDVGCDWIQ